MYTNINRREIPEDSSVEEIMYEIDFVIHVLEGLKDSEEGKTITTDELLNRIWRRNNRHEKD